MHTYALRLFVIILWAVIIMVGLAHAADAVANEVVVTRIEGSAMAFTKTAPAGIAIKMADRLSRDTEVRVAERSRVELRFPDGTVMRLAEKSALKLSDVAYDPKTGSKNIKVDLSIGRLWANVRKLATPDSRVEVKTANAVAGVRGTVYRVNVEEDTSAVVKVYDGAVYVAGLPRQIPKPVGQVSGPVPVPGPHPVPPPYHEVTMEQWHEIVKSFQQITITPQGVASKPQDFDIKEDAKDGWVRWNQELDRQIQF